MLIKTSMAGAKFLGWAILVLFLIVWAFLASILSPWSDEITHMSVARAMIEGGRPFQWDFNQGVLIPIEYTRGYLVSWLSCIVFKSFGISLLAVKAIPMVFTLLTLAVFTLYARCRHKAGAYLWPMAAALFLLNPIILEKSFYVRVYAPLGLTSILSMIFLWELFLALSQSKFLKSCGWGALLLVTIIIPSLDSWQTQHVPILVFSCVLLSNRGWNALVWFLQRKRVWISSLAACLLFLPFVVLVIDQVMSKMSIGNRILGITFVTYWDNVFGIVRFLLATNFLLLGLIWIKREEVKKDFFSWLFLSGVISGLAIGFLNPHNYIFYSRFFYVPVVFVVLGFAGMIARRLEIPVRKFLTIYLVIGAALAFVNFYYDRSNIRTPIAWLEKNLVPSDALVAFDPMYELSGGKELVGKGFVLQMVQSMTELDSLIAYLSRPGVNKVYFLSQNYHQLREELYLRTTGTDRRSINDTYHYLRFIVPGKNVLPCLRMCSLKEYDPVTAVRSLKELRARGFADKVPPISAHKRVLKKLLSMAGLPSAREDILNCLSERK